MPSLTGWDTETYLFRPGLTAPKLVVGSWADEHTEWLTTPDQTVATFCRQLEQGNHLVGINTAFDVVVCAVHAPSILPLVFEAGDAGLFHDCGVNEALNDIAKGELTDRGDDDEAWNRYGQALLMERHFGLDVSSEKSGDVWRFKYAQLDGIPFEQWPDEARAYPMRDARRPREICIRQKLFKNKQDQAAQVRGAIAIALMKAWGFRTDGDYLDHLEREVDEAWDVARVEFSRHKIYRPNGTKDKSVLSSMVTAAYGGKPPMTPGRVKAGKRIPAVATDRDTLVESGDPVLEKLGTSGKNDKRKTTYIPSLRRGTDCPINPEYNILVATGRVSSDWQQMPQKGGLREAIVSRSHLRLLRPEVITRMPDTVLGSLDYGGLELRTMSQRAINEVGFSKMAEYLNSGKDAHSYVGGYFLNIPYEEFLPRKNELKAYRDVAKLFNFGAGGGAGAGALAYGAKVKENLRFCLTLKRATKCGVRMQTIVVRGQKKQVCALCIQIASELKTLWLRAWPEQGALFDKASKITRGDRKVDATVFGSGRVRGQCRYSQWLNTPFQGAGADGMKAAMWEIQRRSFTDRRSALWGSRMALQVHDEAIFEFLEDRAHDAAFEAAQVMVDTMNKVTPDVRNECVPAIMRRLFKSATDVYDKQGRLKPYWPTDKRCAPLEGRHVERCKCWRWTPDSEVMARDLAA